MAAWVEVVLKGTSIADLGMVGVAQGDLIMAGAGAFTFARLAPGAAGHFLKSNGAAAALTWSAVSVAKLEDITDVEAYAGNASKVLTVNAGANDVEWTTPTVGDFLADGTVAMTDGLRLKAQAGEVGIATGDGYLFYDTTAKKVKVYVA